MHENYHGMVTDLVKAVKESAFLLSVTDKKVKKALKKMIDAVERHDAYIAAVERHQNDPEIPKEPVPDPDHPGIYLNTKPPEEEPNVPGCHGGRDGDCNWKHCPQNIHFQSYCPYAGAWERHWQTKE
ncbi:hypothetical protein P11VFA_154 [Rhizobium phage P11VFA]|nr:hypothetical protein P11VFA_154 [Rhizobium phage P11VFA]